MRPEEFLTTQEEPFIQKDFVAKTQLSPEEAKTWLKNMVAERVLGFRKIGRMNVYWLLKEKEPSLEDVKPFTEDTKVPKQSVKDKKTKLTDYLSEKKSKPVDEITKLHDRIHELEEERDLLLNENQRMKHEHERYQARFSDEEDVWREVAEKMAASLAEMRGVTIKEVLKYFEAPHY